MDLIKPGRGKHIDAGVKSYGLDSNQFGSFQ